MSVETADIFNGTLAQPDQLIFIIIIDY